SPWLVMLCVADGERLGRFWWLWPVQIIVLASSVTHLASRFRLPRYALGIGALALVVALVPNTRVIARVNAWADYGWAGPSECSIAAMDYLGNLIKSRGTRQAAIGYQIPVQQFKASFNFADPRYKAGANLDLLLKYRHGVTNRNNCAEGIADD